MVTINTSYRAQVGDPGTDSAGQAELRRRLEEALRELSQFEQENTEWLNEEQIQELGRLQVVMQAESAAIDAYSQLNGPASPAAAASAEEQLIELPPELTDGWNGLYSQNNFETDRAVIEGNTARYGSYEGTIEIVMRSGPEPTWMGFSMTDDMTDLDVESHGRDLVFTATYQDGHKASWLVKEGTVRPEPIVIDATRLSHGVDIDLSRAYRISDGNYNRLPGEVTGFIVHGSEHNDTIVGSQGEDWISGYAGDDTINAQSGRDHVWGDEWYGTAGAFNSAYGGRDTIYGGGGEDELYGGGGIDYRGRSDNPTVDNPESAVDIENTVDDVSDGIPSGTDWFDGSSGWSITETDHENGMVTISQTGDGGGNINIDMGNMPGYTMAFAEGDADGSLIITFVGEDASGNQKTFKIKIEDFLMQQSRHPEDVITLNMEGSGQADIIDFSQLRGVMAPVGGQVINILGRSGDDMILGAESGLLRDGLDITNLLESQRNTAAELSGIIENDLIVQSPSPEDEEEYPFSADVNGHRIDISAGGAYDPDRDTALQLEAPAGYDRAYIMADPDDVDGENQGYYLILVKPGVNGAETIVIHLDSYLALDPDDITIAPASTGAVDYAPEIIPTAISSDLLNDAGYTLNGGSGNDVLFGQRGSRFNSTGEEGDDTQVEFIADPDSAGGLNGVPASGSPGVPEIETPEETEGEDEDEGDDDPPAG
ncbi:MAG: hypothetical protein HY465_01025 [Deltaproteobacteria bacterium]|nr:hypothetical protein [Deltaproteobacteria bacterium]